MPAQRSRQRSAAAIAGIVLIAAQAQGGAAPAAGAIAFKDVAAEAGVAFVHTMARSGSKYMIETMGAGGGFVDYDRDGDLDIVLVDGAPLPGYTGPGDLHSVLYRNDGNGRFTDVTAGSGAANRGYGMG